MLKRQRTSASVGGDSGATPAKKGTTATKSPSTPSRGSLKVSSASASDLLVTPERPTALAASRTTSLSIPGSPQPSYTPPYMPYLFALVDYNSPTSVPLTVGEREVLEMVLENYIIPDPKVESLGPISGLTSERVILRAYYTGRLSIKEGKERTLVCSKCGEGHSPDHCTA